MGICRSLRCKRLAERRIVLSPGPATRAEASLSNGNLAVVCPANDDTNFAAIPIHHNPDHVLLRPFDKLIARGPPVGRVHYGLLVDAHRRQAWIPYALAILTDRAPPTLPFRRLILYVGSNDGMLFPTRQVLGRALHPHHFTFDAHPNMTMSGHASFPRNKNGRAEMRLSTLRVPAEEFGEAHLGTFLLAKPASVQPAGFAVRSLPSRMHSRSTEIVSTINVAIDRSHPVHELEGTWGHDAHLQFSMILSRHYPARRSERLPLIGKGEPWKTEMPQQFPARATGIELDGYWLTIACAKLPGQPTGGANAWTSWKERRAQS